jgi:hypothetical protein
VRTEIRALREDWAPERRAELVRRVTAIALDPSTPPRTVVLAFKALITADQADLAARRLDQSDARPAGEHLHLHLPDMIEQARAFRQQLGIPEGFADKKLSNKEGE